MLRMIVRSSAFPAGSKGWKPASRMYATTPTAHISVGSPRWPLKASGGQ